MTRLFALLLPLAGLFILVRFLVASPDPSDVSKASAPEVMPAANPPADEPDFSSLPELSLSNLIKRPVGPLGLEFSDQIKQLDGQRVQVTGFMIHTDWADRSVFMMSDYPSNVSEREFGSCDDLPPMQLFVKVPPGMQSGVQRGVLHLAGTLRLGPADEPYDRRSFIRLELDPALNNWHVSQKVVSAWSEKQRSRYKDLCAQQSRISCTSCARMSDPRTPLSVSPTTNINTRKNKL